jgi:hypothetical protein
VGQVTRVSWDEDPADSGALELEHRLQYDEGGLIVFDKMPYAMREGSNIRDIRWDFQGIGQQEVVACL